MIVPVADFRGIFVCIFICSVLLYLELVACSLFVLTLASGFHETDLLFGAIFITEVLHCYLSPIEAFRVCKPITNLLTFSRESKWSNDNSSLWARRAVCC